jgi:hypothetical protein
MRVAFFIEQIAIGLYALIAFGVVFQWYRWRLARWAYRATQFELERDLARYRSSNQLTGLVLLVELGLIVAGVQNVVAPTLREVENIDDVVEQIVVNVPFTTPTPGARATVEFNADSIIFQDSNPAEEIFFTPTDEPTAVGTIMPNAPQMVGCDSPMATLQIPANGMKVFQITEVVGTAFTDNFASYKLEIKGPSTFNNFATLEGGISPLTESGSLGQFNPSPYEPGWYQFRVVVFDTTDTMKASCTINIQIEEAQPTRTPLPAGSPPPPGAG